MKNKTLGILFGITLWVSLVLSVIHFSSLDLKFYENKYASLDVAENIGISSSDLMKATNVLLAYLEGKSDNLNVIGTIDGVEQEVFNDKEKDHMIDVQVLFVKTIWIRNGAIAIGLLSLIAIYLLNKKDSISVIVSGIKTASAILGFVFAFLVTFAVLDFSSFWIFFHKVLFSNDLWLLNPYTDNLILMVPLPFFFSLVSLILYRIILGLGFLFTIVYGLENNGYNHRFLKWFALITMTIDHVGHFIFPDLIELRVVGRLAFPIFAYLFANTYRFTSNKNRLLIQVSVTAVITQILLYLANITELVNVFFLFTIVWFALKAFDDKRMWLVVVLAGVAEILTVDYGMYGIFAIVLFYAYYGNKKAQLSGFAIVTLIYILLPFLSSGIWSSIPTIIAHFFDTYWVYFIQALSIASVGLLWFYQSEKPIPYSNKTLNITEKYAFYIYYPLHLFILGLLRSIL
ncbi:MAG TPA: TIGR01906 family membrane protein [Erysipelotrichaceae bacterium]|nr:TIGR01906 family membrane protein [Erysipelotrichaceae bacterium]